MASLSANFHNEQFWPFVYIPHSSEVFCLFSLFIHQIISHFLSILYTFYALAIIVLIKLNWIHTIVKSWLFIMQKIIEKSLQWGKLWGFDKGRPVAKAQCLLPVLISGNDAKTQWDLCDSSSPPQGSPTMSELRPAALWCHSSHTSLISVFLNGSLSPTVSAQC